MILCKKIYNYFFAIINPLTNHTELCYTCEMGSYKWFIYVCRIKQTNLFTRTSFSPLIKCRMKVSDLVSWKLKTNRTQSTIFYKITVTIHRFLKQFPFSMFTQFFFLASLSLSSFHRQHFCCDSRRKNVMEMYINVINCGQTKITVSPQSNTAKCIVNNSDSDYCNYFYNLRLVTESIVCLMECIRLDTNEREKKQANRMSEWKYIDFIWSRCFF